MKGPTMQKGSKKNYLPEECPEEIPVTDTRNAQLATKKTRRSPRKHGFAEEMAAAGPPALRQVEADQLSAAVEPGRPPRPSPPPQPFLLPSIVRPGAVAVTGYNTPSNQEPPNVGNGASNQTTAGTPSEDETLVMAELVESEKVMKAEVVDDSEGNAYRRNVRILLAFVLIVVIVAAVTSTLFATDALGGTKALVVSTTAPSASQVPSLMPSLPPPPSLFPSSQPSTLQPSSEPSTPSPTTSAPSSYPSRNFRRRIWTLRGEAIDFPEPKGGLGRAVALSGDGSVVATTVEGYSQVQVFSLSGSRWVQRGSSIRYTAEWFGEALDMDRLGTIVVVGDPGCTYYCESDQRPGSVAVYRFVETEDDWEPLGDPVEGINANDQFGTSVGLSGDGQRFVAASPKGYVQVYEFVDGTWKQLGGTLVGAMEEDMFGDAVDISADGNHIIVGAPNSTTATGAGVGQVKVYEWNGSVWNTLYKEINGSHAGMGLGSSVAIADNGTTFVAGTGESSGDAFIFRTTDPGDLDPLQNFTISGGRLNSYDGTSVDITWDGLSVAVGVPDGPKPVRVFGLSYESGDCFDYELRGQAIVSVLEGDNDDFGAAVALDDTGQFLAVGAPIFWFICEDSGRVSVFELT